MREDILNLLKNTDDFISGQKISDKLNVSRTAIWKYINGLKEEGYKIESVSRKGYKLISSPDVLTYEEIKDLLKTDYIGKKIFHYDTIDSTNTRAKELVSKGEGEGTIVISEEQTLGKGRLGRQWQSPKGKGIWMSIILKPDINPVDASKITQIGAASVWEAISKIGLKPYIKWPNDIILNSKKVSGTLTEMSGELNQINYVVIGIGINVNAEAEDFSEEVKPIATSIKAVLGKKVSRKHLVADILNKFEVLYNDFLSSGSISKSIEICRKGSKIIDKEVRLISRGTEVKVKVIDVTEDGELLVKDVNGNIKKIISGEISVRGLEGYI